MDLLDRPSNKIRLGNLVFIPPYPQIHYSFTRKKAVTLLCRWYMHFVCHLQKENQPSMSHALAPAKAT